MPVPRVLHEGESLTLCSNTYAFRFRESKDDDDGESWRCPPQQRGATCCFDQDATSQAEPPAHAVIDVLPCNV